MKTKKSEIIIDVNYVLSQPCKEIKVPKTLWDCKKKRNKLLDHIKILDDEIQKIISEDNVDQEYLEKINTRISHLNTSVDSLNEEIQSYYGDDNFVKETKYTARTIKLGSFYRVNKLWKKALIVAFCSAFISVLVWFFVQKTGIYSFGISGSLQGIARIVKTALTKDGMNLATVDLIYSLMFYGMYLLANIPLLIFSWFKLGKQFTILTAVCIVFTQCTGLVIDNIPGAASFKLFGNVGLDIAAIVAWDNKNPNSILVMFVSGIIMSLFDGLLSAIIYIVGSSMAGTDFLAYYTEKKKNKSISVLLLYFNLASLLIGVSIGSIGSYFLDPNQFVGVESVQAIFSPNLVVSILDTVIFSLVIGYFFPKNKIVNVQVDSEKSTEIVSRLLYKNWTHKIRMKDTVIETLDSEEEANSFSTICLYKNIPWLVQQIKKIDEDSIVYIHPILGIDGEIKLTNYTETNESENKQIAQK